MSNLERRNDFRARIAELEDRLKLERSSHAGVQRNLETRIAELEAERTATQTADLVRIKKLEAERDRLKAALTAEREACAAVAEQFWECVTPDDVRHLQKRIAQAIRARAALSAARIAELEEEVVRVRDAAGAKDARIAELEAELETEKWSDNSRNIEAQKIGSEFVRLQAARIAELEAAVLAEREACAKIAAQGREWMAQAVTQESRIAELEAENAEAKSVGEWNRKILKARIAELIAELEAENVSIMATDKRLISENTQLANDSIVAKARIAELEAELLRYEKLLLDREAERDRLKARLASLVRYCDYRREQTGGGEPPELVEARAALSDPSVKP